MESISYSSGEMPSGNWSSCSPAEDVAVDPARVLTGEVGDQRSHVGRRTDQPIGDRSVHALYPCRAHGVGADAEWVELDGDADDART